jgi:preprotein translocase subunit YajC
LDGEPSIIVQLAPLILIFVVFYFLLIRPQQKRMKEHREMLANLRRGDRVVTGGGIIGQIVKVGEDELTVEIGEGMRVKVLRSTVSSVLSKPEPARGGGRPAKGSAGKDREPAEEADEEPAAEEGEAKPERKGRFASRK